MARSRRLSGRRNRRRFALSARRTKKLNLSPRLMRGGIRL